MYVRPIGKQGLDLGKARDVPSSASSSVSALAISKSFLFCDAVFVSLSASASASASVASAVSKASLAFLLVCVDSASMAAAFLRCASAEAKPSSAPSLVGCHTPNPPAGVIWPTETTANSARLPIAQAAAQRTARFVEDGGVGAALGEATGVVGCQLKRGEARHARDATWRRGGNLVGE